LPKTTFTDVDNSDSGWQITVGYDVNPHLALEMSYVDYGQQNVNLDPPALIANPFSTTLPPGQISQQPPNLPVAFIGVGVPALQARGFTTETTGLRLATIGNIPLNQLLRIHVQGGALVPRYKMTETRLVPDLSGGIPSSYIPVRSEQHTDVSNEAEIFLGLGVYWNVSPSFGAKLFWEKIKDLGDENTIEQDLDTYNLSLRYKF